MLLNFVDAYICLFLNFTKNFALAQMILKGAKIFGENYNKIGCNDISFCGINVLKTRLRGLW